MHGEEYGRLFSKSKWPDHLAAESDDTACVSEEAIMPCRRPSVMGTETVRVHLAAHIDAQTQIIPLGWTMVGFARA